MQLAGGHGQPFQLRHRPPGTPLSHPQPPQHQLVAPSASPASSCSTPSGSTSQPVALPCCDGRPPETVEVFWRSLGPSGCFTVNEGELGQVDSVTGRAGQSLVTYSWFRNEMMALRLRPVDLMLASGQHPVRLLSSNVLPKLHP
eukprot:1454241-Rhodomonas_salina.1